MLKLLKCETDDHKPRSDVERHRMDHGELSVRHIWGIYLKRIAYFHNVWAGVALLSKKHSPEYLFGSKTEPLPLY